MKSEVKSLKGFAGQITDNYGNTMTVLKNVSDMYDRTTILYMHNDEFKLVTVEDVDVLILWLKDIRKKMDVNNI